MSTAGHDVHEGQVLPGRTIGPLSRLDFARFSIATDDPNTVHIDEAVARAAGFPTVIGSGGIVAALLEQVPRKVFGLGNVLAGRGRMLAPLFPGAVLHAHGTVVRLRQDDGGSRIAECEVVLEDQDGRRIGEATFTCRVG